MIVTMDSKRRLSVPVALSEGKVGDYFDVQFDGSEDAFVFPRIAVCGDWLKVIKECPVPMDDIPPRRREFACHYL